MSRGEREGDKGRGAAGLQSRRPTPIVRPTSPSPFPPAPRPAHPVPIKTRPLLTWRAVFWVEGGVGWAGSRGGETKGQKKCVPLPPLPSPPRPAQPPPSLRLPHGGVGQDGAVCRAREMRGLPFFDGEKQNGKRFGVMRKKKKKKKTLSSISSGAPHTPTTPPHPRTPLQAKGEPPSARWGQAICGPRQTLGRPRDSRVGGGGWRAVVSAGWGVGGGGQS